MKTTFTIFLVASFINILFAQDLSPVKWEFSTEKIDSEDYKITFTANIEKGWAIYSQHTNPDGPVPTSFVFEENENIVLIEDVKEPDDVIKNYDEMFEMEVIKLKGAPQFMQKVKSKKDGNIIKGTLTFMCCDDKKCLPPADVDFEVVIKSLKN